MVNFNKALLQAKKNLEKYKKLEPVLLAETNKGDVIVPLFIMTPDNKHQLFRQIGEKFREDKFEVNAITLIDECWYVKGIKKDKVSEETKKYKSLAEHPNSKEAIIIVKSDDDRNCKMAIIPFKWKRSFKPPFKKELVWDKKIQSKQKEMTKTDSPLLYYC